MCPNCGQPSYNVESNASDDPAMEGGKACCSACWWERQVARINQLFASLESCEHFHDPDQPMKQTGIYPNDPKMRRGEKRRVVHKYEPMGG